MKNNKMGKNRENIENMPARIRIRKGGEKMRRVE
jgi:hypothetical protein